MGYIFEVSIIQSGWALNEDDDTAGGQFDAYSGINVPPVAVLD